MHTEKDLFEYLDKIEILHKTYYHEPVLTVEQAEKAYINSPAFGQCKNLFLKDRRKKIWLLVAHKDTNIMLKKIAKALDAPELRFASPELLKENLGVAPGAVTPFGVLNDSEHKVNVILDPALFDYELVGFHPLHNAATTLIKPADLKKFIEQQGNTIIMLPQLSA